MAAFEHATMQGGATTALLTRLGPLHILEKKTFSTLTFCNLCRDFMWGLTNQGVCCVVCGYAAHSRCIETSQPENSCRLTSLPALCGLGVRRGPAEKGGMRMLTEEAEALAAVGMDSEQDVFEVHHWVEGNTHVGGSCFLCASTINSQGVDSFRCSRCRGEAHGRCILGSPETVCSPLHERLLVRKRQHYPETSTPLLVFVNSRSGGQQGAHLIRKFRKLLNPNQVVDLDQGGPIPALRRLLPHPRLRLLACGGDGTVGWVLSALDEFPTYKPEVAVLPLGTGNDLARVLGWGGGYAEEKLSPILDDIERAQCVLLDRWKLTVVTPLKANENECEVAVGEAKEKEEEEEGGYEVTEDGMRIQQETVVNNYFSIGIDATAALAFHRLRNEVPALCSTRLGNKMWYAYNGIKLLFEDVPTVETHVQVEVDGQVSYVGDGVGSLIFLNLPSYMGGADMWGTHHDEQFSTPSMSDRKLEVVTVSGPIHLANCAMKLTSAGRRCQGTDIRIKFTKPRTLCMQVDGEPWEQQPAEIRISHWNQVAMLKCDRSRSHAEYHSTLDFHY